MTICILKYLKEEMYIEPVENSVVRFDEELGEENLRKKTENLLTPYGKIEEIKITFEEYADSVRAKAEVTLLDRIDEKQPFEPKEKERESLNEF